MDFGFTVNPRSFAATILNKIENDPDYKIFVAEVAGDIVGGVGMCLVRSEWDSNQIIATEKFWYVEPKYRNTRIAIKLFKESETWSRRFADIIVYVAMSRSSNSAGRFYEKKGYQKLEQHYIKENN